jgi:P2-related tail formation protein
MANLYPNSLAKHDHIKAFDTVTEQRLADLATSNMLVYLIDNVVPEALPVLASQFDVLGNKGWLFADTEQKQRDLLKNAIKLHKTKGTPFAIKNALANIGLQNAQIIEGSSFTPDYYNGVRTFNGAVNFGNYSWAEFRVLLDITTVGATLTPTLYDLALALIDEYKNVRSHLIDLSLGVFSTDSVTVTDGVLSTVSLEINESISINNTYSGAFLFDGTITHDGEGVQIQIL